MLISDLGTRGSGLRAAEHAGHAPRPPLPLGRLCAVAVHQRGVQRSDALRTAPLPTAQFQEGRAALAARPQQRSQRRSFALVDGHADVTGAAPRFR